MWSDCGADRRSGSLGQVQKGLARRPRFPPSSPSPRLQALSFRSKNSHPFLDQSPPPQLGNNYRLLSEARPYRPASSASTSLSALPSLITMSTTQTQTNDRVEERHPGAPSIAAVGDAAAPGRVIPPFK